MVWLQMSLENEPSDLLAFARRLVATVSSKQEGTNKPILAPFAPPTHSQTLRAQQQNVRERWKRRSMVSHWLFHARDCIIFRDNAPKTEVGRMEDVSSTARNDFGAVCRLHPPIKGTNHNGTPALIDESYYHHSLLYESGSWLPERGRRGNAIVAVLSWSFAARRFFRFFELRTAEVQASSLLRKNETVLIITLVLV